MKLVPFIVSGCGNNADEAFYQVISLANIDKKPWNNLTDYTQIEIPVGPSFLFARLCPQVYAQSILDSEEPNEVVRCIDLNDDEYIFFGWCAE